MILPFTIDNSDKTDSSDKDDRPNHKTTSYGDKNEKFLSPLKSLFFAPTAPNMVLVYLRHAGIVLLPSMDFIYRRTINENSSIA
ncbi:hypothetical protein J4727_02410 [Providencia rettgeri]|uniref:Uncharacterized protein n=1 Tax=Providencia rettgeri TaxID=587 RepID=A0A939NJE7_PRORE|nr:hypothetical protein [Providencia rettgeri]